MDLSATDWAVLHVIALHADKAGHAYPSLARIAEIAGIQSRHVGRSTKRLERFGLLRFKRLRRGSGWANNQYEIPLDAPSKVVPEMGLPDDAHVLPAVGLPDDAHVLPAVGLQVVPPQGIPSDGALTERLLPGRYQSGRKKVLEKEESLEGSEEMDEKAAALAAARPDPNPGKPASTISSAGSGNGRLKPGMRGFDKFD